MKMTIVAMFFVLPLLCSPVQTAAVAKILDETKCSMLNDGARLSFSKEDTSSMKNRQVAAGERVEFKCGVIGAPLANIRWKHNGIFLEQSVNGSSSPQLHRVTNGDLPVLGMVLTVSVLVIDCVDEETTGLYMCIAENNCLPAIEASAVVSMHSADAENHTRCPAQKTDANLAPKIVVWTDIIIERPEASVTLICRSSGYPVPLIQWFKEGDDNGSRRIQNDGQYELHANGDMLIRGSKIADKKAAGFISYYCNATNELGSDSQITVVVRANL